MPTAIASTEPNVVAIQTLAHDFRQFVASLQQPRLADRAWVKAAHQRCHELSERFGQLRESMAERRQSLANTLADMRASLHSCAQALSDRYSRQHFAEIQASLVRKYEDFVAQMRSSRLWAEGIRPRFRSLRLPKAARSIFHAGMGLFAVLMYELVFTRASAIIVLGSLLAVAVGLEVSRRFSSRFNDFMVDKVFGAISRPQERYKTNSATYYLAALTTITLLAPQPAVCLALLVLAFGDPLASFVGSRWGRVRLFNDKSLIGCLAFFSVSLLAGLTYLTVTTPELALFNRLGIVAAIAGVGALVELFSHRIDDNFSIPVACALTGLLFF